MKPRLNPELDLMLERTIDVSPEVVWKLWTTPEHLMPWFCPLPWKTVACEIDLKPGGKFFTTMQSPEGQKFPNEGCYLEIIKNQKLVWTSALAAGYRPVAKAVNGADMAMTAMIILEPAGKGTKYTAIALHSNPEDAQKHREMGFEQGWGAALDQLVEYAKKIN